MFPSRYGRRNSSDSPTPVPHTLCAWEGVVGGQTQVVCVRGREQLVLFLVRCGIPCRTSRRAHMGLCCLLSGCGTSPRPISTGRLGITAVHLRPINPVFCWGPYPVDPVGNLILKRASRLDAFSGYHFRT